MGRLLSAIEQLLIKSRSPGTLPVQHEASVVALGKIRDATTQERAESLAKLAAALPEMHPAFSPAVAMTCGALVENGCDPLVAGPTLLNLAERNLGGAAGYLRLCEAKARADGTWPETDDEEGENEDDDRVPLEELLNQYIHEIHEENQEAALAIMGSEHFALATIAHLSRSKPLRAAARQRPELLAKSIELDDLYQGARSFLTKMLMILDDEPLLILDAGQLKGYRGKMSGMPDNFSLHMFLMGTLVGDPKQGWLTAKNVDLKAIRLAMTQLCHDQGPVLTGAFNLWNWTGVQADGTLPAGSLASDAWIWNEGVPTDIVPFEGQRIVVLGEPSYHRQWRGGLVFGGLPPELEIQEKLPEASVREWLKKLGTAIR